jgi:hypothetical protein
MLRPLAWIVVLVPLAAGCPDRQQEEPLQADRPAVAAPSPFRVATLGFFDDATSGRWGAAYARTSAAYRETIGVDAFSAAMARSPWFRAGAKFDTPGGSSEYPRQVARLEGWIQAPAGYGWTTVYFGYEDDRWAITGMQIGGLPGLPMPPSSAPSHDAGRR